MFGYLRFPSGRAAHLHLSWLDPHKERRFTVVGSKRMATFDDMDIERKVTIYDKGFDEDTGSYGEYITRSGDIWSPQIPNREPLRIECEHFVECIREGRQPLSDGASGLRVVRVLEGLQARLDATGGSRVQPSDRAPGLILGEGVELPDDVQLGAYVVIHPGTVVGAGCVIQDRVVLGKPPKLAAHSSAPRDAPPPLVLAPGAVVRAGRSCSRARRWATGAIVGDQAFVRERACSAPKRGGARVGDRQRRDDRRAGPDPDRRLHHGRHRDRGRRVRRPGRDTTNDSTMARHPPDSPMEGALLRRACRVGGGVVLCPGVEIGEEAFIAAGAVVARDIPPRGVAMGVPARVVREVPDEDLLERWR